MIRDILPDVLKIPVDSRRSRPQIILERCYKHKASAQTILENCSDHPESFWIKGIYNEVL